MYIYTRVCDCIIYSLYITNDYYFDPDVRFIESRSADGLFFNDMLRTKESILEEFDRLNIKYVFINEAYLNGKPYADYNIISSNSFKDNYLE